MNASLRTGATAGQCVRTGVRAGGSERDDDAQGPGNGTGVGTIVKTQPKTKKPSMYRVLLLNDDYTPMDFVIVVLQKYFGMDRERATRVMLQVHREGMGVCGVFPRDIATTKVEQVTSFARQHQHPLACVMEEN